MDQSTEFFPISKVKLRTPQFIFARTLLIFTLFYTVSFIFGCILFHFTDMQMSEGFNTRILSYFSVDLLNCSDIFVFSSLLLNVSKSDIYHLLIIFSAGFTMMCGVVVTSLLAFRGFSFGFSISYFVLALRKGYVTLDRPILSLAVFLFISALTITVLLNFSVKTVFFCDKFKSLCGIPKKIMLSKDLYAQIWRFFTAFGIFLLLNFIRCLL